MKMKHLLPIAVALMLVTPSVMAATGEGTRSVNHLFKFTVDPYMNITDTTASGADTSTAHYDLDYAGINLDSALIPSFKVVTNHDDDTLFFTAKTKVGGADVAALGGTDKDKPIIAFANTTHTTGLTADAVSAAIAGTDVKSSPNVIAFQFNFDRANCCDTDTPATLKSTDIVPAKGHIKYTLKNGIYNFKYTSAQTAHPGSFSTHDEDGIYQTTITMSQAEL